MADHTGKDVGAFFKSLGEGVTGIIGGVGATLQSGANYNNATAAQIQANAMTSQQRLDQKKISEARNIRMIIFIFIIIAIVPLVGLALLKS